MALLDDLQKKRKEIQAAAWEAKKPFIAMDDPLTGRRISTIGYSPEGFAQMRQAAAAGRQYEDLGGTAPYGVQPTTAQASSYGQPQQEPQHVRDLRELLGKWSNTPEHGMSPGMIKYGAQQDVRSQQAAQLIGQRVQQSQQRLPSAAQPGYYEGPATPVPGASSIPGAAKGTPGPSGEQLRQQLLDRLAAVTAGTAAPTGRERQIAAMYPGETQTAVQGYDTVQAQKAQREQFLRSAAGQKQLETEASLRMHQERQKTAIDVATIRASTAEKVAGAKVEQQAAKDTAAEIKDLEKTYARWLNQFSYLNTNRATAGGADVSKEYIDFVRTQMELAKAALDTRKAIVPRGTYTYETLPTDEFVGPVRPVPASQPATGKPMRQSDVDRLKTQARGDWDEFLRLARKAGFDTEQDVIP